MSTRRDWITSAIPRTNAQPMPPDPEGIRDAILTTTPVLTEAFPMLGPAGIGSDRLREFVEDGRLSVWSLDQAW